MNELKPCPFCGGEAKVIVMDDEFNVRDAEYASDPWSGILYGLSHTFHENPDCPIASDEELVGSFGYDTESEAIEAWNRRADESEEKDKRVAELEAQLGEFSAFLCDMTGGRMSKTNYSAQTMISQANDYQQEQCDECEKNGWISVKDELPKSIANKVIVCCENGYIGYGHFERHDGKEVWYNLETSEPFTDWNDGICEGYTVTHWQPLPKPPKED